ncbi:hypothetical protein GOBAR_AA05513 [Gossypium barbadense]|uniref:Uncharacterized protein n=1 Tax=Gossypium barbadense TaxID=3634 RepID=A0A2P5YHK9_GOSBA|nr:hypothetical protein GOBAR_AA05513 [Gossypium barbadense]
METDAESVLGQQWPVRPDILGIKEKLQATANGKLAIQEAKKRLLAVRREFEDNIKETLKKQQLYEKGNNQVGVEHFPGLAEELQTTDWGKTPSSFESIAARIEKDRGKVTEVGHIAAQVLVCAAVKEMEEFSVEKLDIEMLKKWGATLNKAKELGFQVGFADNFLRKNLYAYFGYKTTLDEAKEKEV